LAAIRRCFRLWFTDSEHAVQKPTNGFSVNIQAANHVIHYLRQEPAKEDQATDRAYRIGQTRDVHVHCPLTTAQDFKTFDVKFDELLRKSVL